MPVLKKKSTYTIVVGFLKNRHLYKTEPSRRADRAPALSIFFTDGLSILTPSCPYPSTLSLSLSPLSRQWPDGSRSSGARTLLSARSGGSVGGGPRRRRRPLRPPHAAMAAVVEKDVGGKGREPMFWFNFSDVLFDAVMFMDEWWCYWCYVLMMLLMLCVYVFINFKSCMCSLGRSDVARWIGSNRADASSRFFLVPGALKVLVPKPTPLNQYLWEHLIVAD